MRVRAKAAPWFSAFVAFVDVCGCVQKPPRGFEFKLKHQGLKLFWLKVSRFGIQACVCVGLETGSGRVLDEFGTGLGRVRDGFGTGSGQIRHGSGGVRVRRGSG